MGSDGKAMHTTAAGPRGVRENEAAWAGFKGILGFSPWP
jgi:hypothetical protein